LLKYNICIPEHEFIMKDKNSLECRDNYLKDTWENWWNTKELISKTGYGDCPNKAKIAK